MTNPGHVDPGYVGPMRFTVMNVGKADITLRTGDPIVTLLFFRLSGDAHAGYAQRNGLVSPVSGPSQNDVNLLSLDFLDVSGRADAAATKAVANAEFRAKVWGFVISPLAGIITALVVGFFSVWQPMNQVKTDLEQVKKVLDLKEAKSRLDKFDEMEKLQKRIDELENTLKSQSGPKAGGNNP
jgi:hypothetical protein